jgi:trimeric autotransporter adhesin
MVVVTIQAQTTSGGGAVGMPASDGVVITRADLNKVIAQKLLEMLPALTAIVQNPAYTTPAAIEAAVIAALAPGGSLNPSLVTPPEVVVTVPVLKPPAAQAAYVPTAGSTLTALSFFDVTNWNTRFLTSSLVQATPDANGNLRYVDRRARTTGVTVATWGFGGDPWRQADLHWNGAAWVACQLNGENLSTVRDAAGNNSYKYCDGYSSGVANRVTVDISGKTMAGVYNDIVVGKYTNIFINPVAVTALGSATFPPLSNLFYQTGQDLTKAVGFYPGSGNVLFNYSTAITAGGDGRIQAAGVGCNSAEFVQTPTNLTATLEDMVAAFKGKPCLFNVQTLVGLGGVVYSSDPVSEVWGATSLSIGTVGTAPISATPTSYYTGNQLIRMAFTGIGTNEVTYYTCKQRQIGGNVRNCTPIGVKGSYTITTLPDMSRIMTFSNYPAEAASLTYTRVFVERNGGIYFGYQDKNAIYRQARFSKVAAEALLSQLTGAPVVVNPEVPLALTATSYQGVWNMYDLVGAVGNTITFYADGTSACQITATGVFFTPCALTVTNPATGAFSFHGSNPIDPTGTVNFVTGIGGGTYDNAGMQTAFTIKRR